MVDFMLCIFQNLTDIYFNLAAEEYLLKKKEEDILMLWISEPSIVVGKHQNAFAEINHKYVYEHNIPVARRLSGGGTVFHDQGNLNFTYILNGEPGKLVDFKRFVMPVVNFLNTIGIHATIGLKNDILLNGLKISGNAEHIHKKRVLHHGTLLYNSNLDSLRQALKVVPGRYIGKAVQSNRASVDNISDYLGKKWGINDFATHLFRYLRQKFPDSIDYAFSKPEENEIFKIRNEKYVDWNWNFGYSPAFSIHGEIVKDNQFIKIEIFVEKGIVKEVLIRNTAPNDLFTLLNSFRGNRFSYKVIMKIINDSDLPNADKEQLELMFF